MSSHNDSNAKDAAAVDDASEDAQSEQATGGDGGADSTESSAPEAAAGDGSEATEESPEEQLAKMRDRLMRTAADFDNYRKRTRRDIADAERRVQEDLVRALLPTFDNIERAVAHAESARDVKSLADGLQMVMKQFMDTLGGLGIERVESLGKAFDPADHEAVQHLVTSEVAAGVVTQELQAGYRWKGRLVRPAMVVVAKAPSQPPPAGESEDE